MKTRIPFFPSIIVGALAVTLGVVGLASGQAIVLNSFASPTVVGPFATTGAGNYQIFGPVTIPNGHNLFVQASCDAADTVATYLHSYRRDVWVFYNLSGSITDAVSADPENYTGSINTSTSFTTSGSSLSFFFTTAAGDNLRVVCVLSTFAN